MAEGLINLISQFTILLGGLAFVTSVVTQVTKGWGILNRIPTKIQVSLTSLILCVIVLFVYLDYYAVTFVWYYLAGTVLLSFFVALITTDGWEALLELWKRSRKESK